ncbi:hypothetical protein GCM10009712_19530 [Pseudarthrobacter sulfonivorans]
MAGGGRSYLNLPRLLGHVFPLGEDGALVPHHLGKGKSGELRHVRCGGAAADARLNVPRGHGNGRDCCSGLRRRPAGRPQCLIDRQLEHLAAGTAQQEMLPVVVYAYKP